MTPNVVRALREAFASARPAADPEMMLPVESIVSRILRCELDLATAVDLAERALVKVYGKHQIDYEKPLTAKLENGVWNVHGTLCCPGPNGQRTCEPYKCVGGVAALQLRQSDGKVLSVSHTK